MDPIGAVAQATMIGIMSIVSIFYVFKKLFSKNVGFIGAFIYACSLPIAFLDRWVVPTQPTILWSIWFLYSIFLLLEGNQKSLILIGLLAGLIWHVHVGLLPLMLLVPISIFLSKKKLQIKYLLIGLIWFIIFTSPFWLFEIRHNFIEIHGFLNSIGLERGEAYGLKRLLKIIDGSSFSVTGVYLFKPKLNHYLSYLILFIAILYGKYKKFLNMNQIILILGWMILIIIAQQTSKRAVPEYYFNSFIPVSLLVFSLFIVFSKAYIFLPILLILNTYFLYTKPPMTNNYLQKKSAVEYISRDATKNAYPCVGIEYIAGLGKNVGFRYLFWKNQLTIIRPNFGSPDYKIVIPDTPWKDALINVDVKFGAYGVILPKTKIINNLACSNPDSQFLPPLGFTR